MSAGAPITCARTTRNTTIFSFSPHWFAAGRRTVRSVASRCVRHRTACPREHGTFEYLATLPCSPRATPDRSTDGLSRDCRDQSFFNEFRFRASERTRLAPLIGRWVEQLEVPPHAAGQAVVRRNNKCQQWFPVFTPCYAHRGDQRRRFERDQQVFGSPSRCNVWAPSLRSRLTFSRSLCLFLTRSLALSVSHTPSHHLYLSLSLSRSPDNRFALLLVLVPCEVLLNKICVSICMGSYVNIYTRVRTQLREVCE